ncbi:carbohydrate ABC transporter permease [Cryptosporangium aurantiacum]|uniref:Carbohydrate ABC transporter membrane protein 2, CUT1 family n=1 Tax=Cryptosporangium aurantiacum TaxID=134849 RepID=A0A1M7RMI2_9ACTN|nr:carbohydrate ABC transporter permease [Cryptosporangium aurantiacum]SHN47298.1 carbohydrate ABC transporter membrane protein 2, CUT1 family [Cryptosporangium aurantiacum]
MTPGRGGSIGTHLLAVVVVAFLAFPVFWALVASFKPPNELYTLAPVADHPTLENYRIALTDLPLARLLLNTAVMALAVTAIQVAVSVLAAYGFTVFRFRGRSVLYLAVIATILVPQQALIIPNYLLAARLGWLNSYLGLVVPLSAVCGFGILLLRQHVEAVPPSLLEAARLDGAYHREILLSVVLPSVRPAISALSVLVFISTWNEYLWPLLIAPSAEQSTVQVGLALFQTQEGSAYGPMMAAATLATLPVLLVYLFNQRRVTDAFLQAGIR